MHAVQRWHATVSAKKKSGRGMQYGYGRVSTLQQDTALQEDAFKRAGVQRIVMEKWSGVGARPQLRMLLARLKAGDEVVVYKLDRLGRSLQDLLSILDQINASGARFRSLTEPIDTGTPAGKLMYSILGAVAEFERSIIRERVVAGQIAARRRGQKWGRPRVLSEEQEQELVFRYVVTGGAEGGLTLADLAREYGVKVGVVQHAVYRVTRPQELARRVGNRRALRARN